MQLRASNEKRVDMEGKVKNGQREEYCRRGLRRYRGSNSRSRRSFLPEDTIWKR